MRQRELLSKKESVIKTEVEKKTQIKTITKELLAKLNESYSGSKLSEDD